MPGDLLSDITSVTLAKVLDGTALRQRTLAENVANVDTPGYQRQDVSFNDQLKEALENTFAPESALRRLEEVTPQTFVAQSKTLRPDGNTVDIDKEMGEMSKNTLEYETAAQLLDSKLRLLRTAITGGR
jgi:flagellar basal-body rod protein FlgB